MKTLIVLSAIPASGKSTWANAYLAGHENVKIVSSDQIRIELTGAFNDHSRQKEVWEIFDQRIKEYSTIEGVTVILDALNDLNSLRQKYVKENPEFDKYILIIFDYDENLSIHYNSAREKDFQVPSEIMKSLIAKFEQVDEETIKLFDEVYKINWMKNRKERIK